MEALNFQEKLFVDFNVFSEAVNRSVRGEVWEIGFHLIEKSFLNCMFSESTCLIFFKWNSSPSCFCQNSFPE